MQLKPRGVKKGDAPQVGCQEGANAPCEDRLTDEPMFQLQSPALLCKPEDSRPLALAAAIISYFKGFLVYFYLCLPSHLTWPSPASNTVGTRDGDQHPGARGSFPTCHEQFPAPKCPARVGLLENHTWCRAGAAAYLEAHPQAAEVASLAQGGLHGVDDHIAHAHPRALGELSRLRVGDQRIADGFREQLWVSKDENPVWSGWVGTEGDEEVR